MVREGLTEDHKLRRFRSLAQLRARWTPNGFSDVRPDLSADFLWRFMCSLFLFPFVIVPVGFTLGLLDITAGQSVDARAIRIFLGFSFTMVAVSLALPVALTWFTMRALSDIKVVTNRTTLRDLGVTLTSWTGVGAALVTTLGMLSFVPRRLGIAGPRVMAEPFPISAFVDYPAVGAAIGFTFGMIHCAIISTKTMENRLVAVTLPPAMLTITVALLSALRFTPYANGLSSLELIMASTPLGAAPPAEPIDWRSMLSWSAHLGGTQNVLFLLPGGRSFTAVVAVGSLTWSYIANRPKRPKPVRGESAGNDAGSVLGDGKGEVRQ